MSVQPKATLKSYFETGDKPTQANFEDLIDSLLDQSDGIKNGGNSFGADAVIGTNDAYKLSFRTNGANNWFINADGKLLHSATSTAVESNGSTVITTPRIGSTTYTGSYVAFANDVSIQANRNIILINTTYPSTNNSISLGTTTRIWSAVHVGIIQGETKSGTDVAGANLTLRSSLGTGSSTPSSIVFETPSIGSSGSTVQTLASRAYVDYNAFYFNVPIRSVSSIQLLDSTYKVSLDSFSSTWMRVGKDFDFVGVETEFRIKNTSNLKFAWTGVSDQATGGLYWWSGADNTNAKIARQSNGNFLIQPYINTGLQTDGVTINANISNISGSAAGTKITGTFNPTSGSGAYYGLNISPTINQAAGTSGTVRGIYYNPTLTSVLGTHYAFEATTGKVLISDTTDATSNTSAAIVTAGGIAAGKSIYATDNFRLVDSSDTSRYVNFSHYLPAANYPRTLIQGGNSASDTNWSLRIAHAYSSSSVAKPVSIVLSSNNDTGSVNANNLILYANTAGYHALYTYAGTSSNGLGLAIGTNVNIASNSSNAAIYIDTVTNGQVVKVQSTTASTSTTTGALTVAGGVGIASNIYAGGNFIFSNASPIIVTTGTLNLQTPGGLVANNGVIISKSTAIASTTTESNMLRVQGTFTPTSGTAVFNAFNIVPVIDQTGTSSGTIRGIYYNPTLTSVLGTHYAFEATSGMVKIGDATTSSSITTGALTVAGGVGIAGKAFIGDQVQVTSPGATIASFLGDNVSGNVFIKIRHTSNGAVGNRGQVLFSAKNSSNSEVDAGDVLCGLSTIAAGSEIGILEFRTRSSASLTTRLSIDNSAAKFSVSISLLDTTYKTALSTSAANTLTLGLGFNTLSVNATTVTLSSGTTISSSGSTTIRTTTTGSATLTLSATGGDSSSNGVILTTSSSLTTTTGGRNIATINPTINQTSGTCNIVGLNIIPTVTSVTGALYGLRSQIANTPTGGGTAWNIYADGTAPNAFGGDIKLLNAGNGLYIKEGTNATMGTATLSSGTVTVSTTKVTANSRIFLTVQSLGTVTSPKEIAVTARTAGTSFTITSADNTDTSVVSWIIIEPS